MQRHANTLDAMCCETTPGSSGAVARRPEATECALALHRRRRRRMLRDRTPGTQHFVGRILPAVFGCESCTLGSSPASGSAGRCLVDDASRARDEVDRNPNQRRSALTRPQEPNRCPQITGSDAATPTSSPPARRVVRRFRRPRLLAQGRFPALRTWRLRTGPWRRRTRRRQVRARQVRPRLPLASCSHLQSRHCRSG